jgi:hypothetical protein
MEICLARGETLGERKWEPGLDENVKTPGLNLGLFVLAPQGCFNRLGHDVGLVRDRFDVPFTLKLDQIGQMIQR